MSEDSSICIRCAECCKNFFFKTKMSNDKLIEFLKKRHVHPSGYWVMEPDDRLTLYINVPCDHLCNGNVCGIYSDRPRMCKEYVCGRYFKSKKEVRVENSSYT